jgi:hypothetical protein
MADEAVLNKVAVMQRCLKRIAEEYAHSTRYKSVTLR